MPDFEGHECLLNRHEENIVKNFIDTGVFISLRRKFRTSCMISRHHPSTERYFLSNAACRNEQIRHLVHYYYMVHPFSMFKLGSFGILPRVTYCHSSFFDTISCIYSFMYPLPTATLRTAMSIKTLAYLRLLNRLKIVRLGRWIDILELFRQRSSENFPTVPEITSGHGWAKDEEGGLRIQWMTGAPAPETVFDLVNFLPVVAQLISEIYLPGDVIINSGSSGSCMFFIYHGTVAVYTPLGRELCHLEDGAHFGEIALIFNETRVATVVAVSACELFMLRRSDFLDTIEPFPKFKEELLTLATERLKKTILHSE
ncbi:hypothetical protein NQ314_009079 [Rhamnusium bicolor]|uniref:Cyclic nucleotide-binding domain-containing protein n=1 Tax=Rhamnusium bicolor TaxID=1586634 RepID=A0AAV8Y2P9_9CUCU|nr:hypothetical protein NQ314_009079 [Rhamnusium bicolor]